MSVDDVVCLIEISLLGDTLGDDGCLGDVKIRDRVFLEDTL